MGCEPGQEAKGEIMMTSIEVGAALASTILKGSFVVAGALLVARCVARTASGASLVMVMGHGALGMVILLGPVFPEVNSGFVAIRHDAVQPVSIGPVTASLASLLVAIWGVGVLVMLGRLLRDSRAAMALTRRAGGQTGRRSGELLIRAARCIGVSRIPQVRETSELATVALIGFWRPVLLLPVQAREWSDEELFGVLCHELEHLRRGDWLMLMIERIIVAIYWVNPLVHLLARQASAMRECAADDAAMRAGAAATAFAGRLISVARDLKRSPRLAVSVAFADGGRVDQRVRALFEERDRRGTGRFAWLRASLVALPLVVALAAVEPWICVPGTGTGTEACP